MTYDFKHYQTENFFDEMLFLFLLCAAAVREKKNYEYNGGNALPDANF